MVSAQGSWAEATPTLAEVHHDGATNRPAAAGSDALLAQTLFGVSPASASCVGSLQPNWVAVGAYFSKASAGAGSQSKPKVRLQGHPVRACSWPLRPRQQMERSDMSAFEWAALQLFLASACAWISERQCGLWQCRGCAVGGCCVVGVSENPEPPERPEPFAAAVEAP